MSNVFYNGTCAVDIVNAQALGTYSGKSKFELESDYGPLQVIPLAEAVRLMEKRACTDAVETEIDRHYGRQLDQLGEDDPELAADIASFRADELEHRDSARSAGATNAIGYPLLTAAIRAGCRAAIELSKRI